MKSSQELHDAKTPTPEYIDAKVIIEASPWVSSKTMKKGYRKAQIEVMGTRGGKAPGSKNLQLFYFVAERVEPSVTVGYTRMPPAKNLVSEWNEAHPEWAYKDSAGDLDTRQFCRDFKRIRRTIAVGPPYQTHRAATRRQPKQADGSS